MQRKTQWHNVNAFADSTDNLFNAAHAEEEEEEFIFHKQHE